MTRLHADPVEVQRQDSGLGPEPAQFLWRGRLYVVREVLARWTEAGGWWRGDAVRALTAGDAAPAQLPEAAGPGGVDDNERDWWRVEADSGRASASSGGSGVYDLCFDWTRGAWSLARVLD